MIIRRAQPEDSAAVFLLARAFATSFAVEQAAFERSFGALLTQPDAFLIVAEAEEEEIALATRRASNFCEALGYKESAMYFCKRL